MLLNCTAAYKYKLYNSIIVVLYLLNPFFGVKYKAYNGCNDICLIPKYILQPHFLKIVCHYFAGDMGGRESIKLVTNGDKGGRESRNSLFCGDVLFE